MSINPVQANVMVTMIPTGIPVLHRYSYKMINVQFDLCIPIAIHKVLGVGPVGGCRQLLAILLCV